MFAYVLYSAVTCDPPPAAPENAEIRAADPGIGKIADVNLSFFSCISCVLFYVIVVIHISYINSAA